MKNNIRYLLEYKEVLTREAVVEADNLEEGRERLGTSFVMTDKAVGTECHFSEAKEIDHWEEE